jgi:type IV secretion system protein VirB5
MTTRSRLARRACLGIVCLASVAPTPSLAQWAVFDGTAAANAVAQIAKMGEQIRALESQLTEAKRLYDSFNQVTSVNDVASLLGTAEFRRHLPQEFSQIEALLNGNGGYGSFAGEISGYLDRNRYYAESPGNSFYAGELDRIARQTGTKHSLGQSVYDTAAKRVGQLEELRRRIASTGSVAEKLDLGNRLQAESSLLQNDLLRMQGLAMIQQARTDMDGQRREERRRELFDQMRGALQ